MAAAFSLGVSLLEEEDVLRAVLQEADAAALRQLKASSVAWCAHARRELCNRLCQREGQPEPAGVDSITDLDVKCLNEAGRPWEVVVAGRELPQLARLHGYGFVVDVQAVREPDLEEDDDDDAPLGGDTLRGCIQGEGYPPDELLLAAVACAASRKVRGVPVQELREDDAIDELDLYGHGIGVTVALCDWERATTDLETILEGSVSEDFEKRRDLAHFEAGHEAMRTFATKALGDALHQPVARTAHKPHILHEPLRSYETLSTYVPFPGADEREIATAQRLLKVSTEPGLVAAAYAVDDDAIGEKWRLERAVQQDESHARVVINGVSDRLCTAVVARVCGEVNARYDPLVLGVDVQEVPGLGLDCHCRRSIQLSCEWCGVDGGKDAARKSLAPYLRDLSERERTPSFLTHAARRLWHEKEDAVSGAVLAASSFLGSDAWFKARPKVSDSASVSELQGRGDGVDAAA